MLVEIAHIISVCDDLIGDGSLNSIQGEKVNDIKETCLNLLKIVESGSMK